MTYNTPIDVYERLKEHYNEAQKLGYEVIGCFLQGSYNYEKNFGDITDDKSDVDSKCLVLPSFKDFCLGRKPVSFTHEMENGEHLDIKDFRLYLNMFKKQNINMVEILFTNYCIWNPKYMNICYRMLSNREKIARYDIKAALNCMVGMAFEKQKALCHPYPSTVETIQKYGFCYHKDTLFLTNSGWKKFDEITSLDKIATMNPSNFQLEFQYPINRIKYKNPQDYLYNIENNFSHFCITEGHELFSSKIINVNKYGTTYNSSRAVWEKQKIEKAIKSQCKRHIINFPKNRNKDYEIDDNLLFLLGAFISEGTILFRDSEHKQIKSAVISQKKNNPKFTNELDKLVKHFNGNKYVYDKETKWVFNSEIAKFLYEQSGHYSYNKHLPNFIYSLSIRQANILLKALLLGDGTNKIKTENRHIYYTISPTLANDMVSLGFLADKTANIMGSYLYDNHYGNKPVYQIAIKEKENIPSVVNLHKHIQKIPYNDDVVCFTVPNGLLITMFNGKPAVQSNCGKQLSHTYRLNEFMDKYIAGESYEKCLKTDMGEFLRQLKRNEIFSLELAKTNMDRLTQEMKQKKDLYLETHEIKKDEYVDKLFEELAVEAMEINFTSYLRDKNK